MSEPLISIIIPCYNIESYIEKTLDSVFAQTYRNIEVIAVDDGSRDGTGPVLDRFAEKEPRLTVLHQDNQGVSAARIHGIEASCGEYIGFVDGDDLIDADMYERLYCNAVTYDADISHCGYRKIVQEKTEYYYNTGETVIQNTKQGICDLLEGKRVEPGLWNKLFRRYLFGPLLRGDTVMDTKMRENEDLLMNYCLFSVASISVYEDFCPYQYIVRCNSSSHGSVKPHILSDPIRIGEILLRETGKNPDLYQLASRYYVTKLIKVVTVAQSSDSPEITVIRQNAARKIKSFLPKYLSLTGEPFRRKLLAVWAAYAPGTYGFVHRVYSHRN